MSHIPTKISYTVGEDNLKSRVVHSLFVSSSILSGGAAAVGPIFAKNYFPVDNLKIEPISAEVNLYEQEQGLLEDGFRVRPPIKNFYVCVHGEFRRLSKRQCYICLVNPPQAIYKEIPACWYCLNFNSIRACTACGGFVHQDEVERQKEEGLRHFLCANCYKNYNVKCEACGFRTDDPVAVVTERTSSRENKVKRYCPHCYQARNINGADPLFQYNYVPQRTIFFCKSAPPATKPHGINESNTSHKSGEELYLGIEVEVECGELSRQRVIKDIKIPDWAYAKHDGSGRNMFEIVNFPISWRFFKRVATPEYKRMFAALDALGCESYDAGTCGIHVHLSRKAFTSDHLLRFLKLVYENPALMFSLSQRQVDALNRYASLISAEPVEDLAKKGSQKDRHYTAVNLLKRHTIELRIFRGTIRPSSFYRAVQTAKAMWQFSLESEDVTGDKFLEWAKQRKFSVELSLGEEFNQEEFPELREFLSSDTFKVKKPRGLINPRLPGSRILEQEFADPDEGWIRTEQERDRALRDRGQDPELTEAQIRLQQLAQDAADLRGRDSVREHIRTTVSSARSAWGMPRSQPPPEPPLRPNNNTMPGRWLSNEEMQSFILNNGSETQWTTAGPRPTARHIINLVFDDIETTSGPEIPENP